MKKILIGCILLACLVLFPCWNRGGIRENRLEIEEDGESNVMLKTFRS